MWAEAEHGNRLESPPAVGLSLSTQGLAVRSSD
jgi:hypothetical protein